MVQPFMRRATALAAFGAVALVTSAALAQTPVRVRGTISAVAGDKLTVRDREGHDVTLAIPEGTRVSAVVKASLSDIKPGVFVGAAAMPMPDGTQRALAISLLPESARASGGTFSNWDLAPDSTMINANVTDRVAQVGTDRLTLTYKDGQKTLLVGPETPIVGFAPATRADMKPDTRVVVFATKEADGSTLARNVVVGRDGVNPPM